MLGRLLLLAFGTRRGRRLAWLLVDDLVHLVVWGDLDMLGRVLGRQYVIRDTLLQLVMSLEK